MVKIKLNGDLLNKLYEGYKTGVYNTLNDLEPITNLDRTTIGKYYKQKYGDDYKKLIKIKQQTKRLTQEQKKEVGKKISQKLKGKKKPPRTNEHKHNLSLALKNKNYKQRYGDQAEIIISKIKTKNIGKKHQFKDKDLWRKNLSNSLKGRSVWNKGRKGLQEAWNKKYLPKQNIIDMYCNGNLSSTKIAKKLRVSHTTILKILKNNNIGIKGSKGFFKGKTDIEILGAEKAKVKKEKLSKIFKGRKCTWGNKISDSIKKHYKIHPMSNELRLKRSVITKNLWKDPNYRSKLVEKHKEFLRNNPAELQRLKEIQLGKITKIENKFLSFLKLQFKENEDFFFDQQDLSGKTLYRPDFQFPKQKIIFELNGYYKHFTKKGKQKDKIREYYLRKAGWKVYKFDFLNIERDYLFEKNKEKVIKLLKNV